MSHPQQEEKVPAVVDPNERPESGDDDSDSDPEEQVTAVAEEGTNIQSSSAAHKKKKKKKSKAKKILDSFSGKNEVPDEVVDQVLDKVKAGGGVAADEANAENIRQALQQLKIMDVARGKAGIGGLNKKDMGEHKVCFYGFLTLHNSELLS